MHSAQPHKLPGPGPRQTAASPCVSPAQPGGFGRSLASTDPQPRLASAQAVSAAALLPGPVLQRIFSYLPLSSHSQCALVCRRWHASVPSTSKDLAQWIAQPGLEHLQFSRQIAASYRHRTGPWLRAERSPFLPMVERQHQELLRLQDCLLQVQSPHRLERLQQQTQQARHLFCALVQYSLYQQLAQADHLSLQPLPPLPDCQGTVMRLSISPGGRWLATKLQPTGSHNRSLLRLYGWQEGAWHLQTLNPPNGPPPRTQSSLEGYIFSLRQPDTLLCNYDGNQIVSWHRNPDSGVWNQAPVLHVADSNKIEDFFLSAEGDLVIRQQEWGRPGQRILVLHDRGSGRGWSTIVSNAYDQLHLLILGPGRHQWATVTSGTGTGTGTGTDTLTISIWERNLNAPSGICGFQETLLNSDQHLLMLYYSPDACHLLGLMTGQRAVLWELDDTRRLQQKLEISCAFNEDYPDVFAQCLFHQSGKRLALPLSTHCIQFWAKHIRGHWFAGARLDMPPDAGDLADDKIRYILWSADGRTLVRVTRWQLDIWCQGSSNRWNRCARHIREDAHAPSLNARWMPPLHRHCLAVLWREGRLWLYGPNRNGTNTHNACLANGAPVCQMAASPDGLSLAVISGASRNLRLLQLSTRTERDIASPAPVTADIMATAGAGTPAQVLDEEQNRPASDQQPCPAQEPAARPPDTATAAICPESLANAGNLPDLALYKIFNYLPLSMLDACALVCRRWYNNLPDTLQQIARWRETQPADHRVRSRLLAAGYSSRSRPFLQAARSPLLPVLEREHQELVRLQALLQPPPAQPDARRRLQQQREKSFRLLSALVHYSLHWQMGRTAQMTLVPVPLGIPERPFAPPSALSPCGRWHASQWPTVNPNADPVMVVHGWKKDGWHTETLVPAPDTPTAGLRFSRTDPDTLLSVHDSTLIVWHKATDAEHWQRRQSWNIPPYEYWHLYSMDGGDIAVLSSRLLEEGKGLEYLLQFFRYINEEQGWEQPVSHKSTATEGIAAAIRIVPTSHLALCLRHRQADSIRNEVHVWYRQPDAAGLPQWHCQVSVLPRKDCKCNQIGYSPSYRYLMALMANRQLCLLKQDAQHRLQEQLVVPCCIAPSSRPTPDLHCLTSLQDHDRQLAVPYSRDKIQLWHRTTDTGWQAGELIEAPPEPDAQPNERLFQVELSTDARTLVRLTNRCLDIWCRVGTHWHHHRHRREHVADWAIQTEVSLSGALCTTVSDLAGNLWIYAPDAQNQVSCKASAALDSQVQCLAYSNDGLSVLTGTATQDIALQLVALPESAQQQDERHHP